MSLFQTIPNPENPGDRSRPLADRMRPLTLDEFVGQEHLVGAGKPLRLQIERDDPGSAAQHFFSASAMALLIPHPMPPVAYSPDVTPPGRNCVR